MAELPISGEDAAREIKALILEKGIAALTSKVIRKHLEAKYDCSLSAHKPEIDRLTMEKIGEVEKEKAATANKSSDSDDESDFEAPVDGRRAKRTTKAKSNGGGGGKRKETGFTSLCKLSEELQEVVGRKYMRRHDVVKAMWAYFREKNLMNPKDRRQVICDEPLRRIFGTKKILAFGMMGGLKEHISVADDLGEKEREKILDELDPDRHTRGAGSDEDEAPKAKRGKAAAKRGGETGPRRESGFTQLMTLSDDLAAVLGHKHMRRHQVVKSMWAYFKSHDLMDPKDRRMVILDEAMKPIFDGEKKIQAFGMMRYLKGHLQPANISDSTERERILEELDAKFGKDEDGKSNGNGSVSKAAAASSVKTKPKSKKTASSSSESSATSSSGSSGSEDEEHNESNGKPNAVATAQQDSGDAKASNGKEDDNEEDENSAASSFGSDDDD